MGPRRSSLPTVSPTSVIVEFHEFDGRWFVTGRWGQGSGTAVKRSVRKSALGKMVLDQAETARQEWRWRSVKTLADETELWERFCVSQAGVPMDRYLPEKRIVILVGQAGIRWHDASQSPPNWERLPDRSARRLGGALIRRMNQLGLLLPVGGITSTGGSARAVPVDWRARRCARRDRLGWLDTHGHGTAQIRVIGRDASAVAGRDADRVRLWLSRR